MNRLLFAVITVLILQLPVWCVPVEPDGQGPPGMTFTTASIPGSSTLVTLTAYSRYITVVNLSTTTTLYFNPAATTATTSHFPIAPNSAYSYTGSPLLTFTVIGSAASGSYGVFAH